jgi:L-alanine-DL-glutamate epimerase-like enolase superfamily enzyme
MVKICALASAYGIPVIPHHGGMASTQLIASQTLTTCPIQEWLLQAGIVGQHFQRHKIEPVGGYIELPTGPGMSMDLDESAIESMVELALS